MNLLLLAGVCFVSSTISGLIGMAGGVFLLTVMLLMGMPLIAAVPLHALIQLASNATRVYAFRGHLRWSALRVFMLVALPLPIIGMQLIAILDEQAIKMAIGFLVLIAAWAPKGGLARLPEKTAFASAGALAGTLGVVIGASGPVIAPFMLREGWSNEEVIATKATAQAFIHIQKLIAFGLAGYALGDSLPMLPPLIVAVVVGTFFGKWLLKYLSKERFRLAYRVVLTLVALRLIVA